MNNILSTAEPQSLLEIGIDYNYLEYYCGSMIISYSDSRSLVNETREIKGKISIVMQYLVLAFTTTTSKKEKLLWISLSEFDYSHELPNHSSDFINSYEISFTHQSRDNIRIILKFEKLNEMIEYEKQVCSICTSINSSTLQQNYQYIKQIGKGTQATIDLYEVNESPYFSKVVVKTYKLINNNYKDKIKYLIENEIRFLRELNFCENVIQLERVYKSDNQYQLVMNFAKNGTLRDYRIQKKVITESEIRYIMEQLLLTMDLFHQKNILHRDIKPDNILLMNKEELSICVGDLGFACSSKDEQALRMKCGTPGYVEPEVLKGHPFSKKSDIFSLGCLMYYLITGKQLYNGRTSKIILEKNESLDPSPLVRLDCSDVSTECQDLLLQMTNISRQNRPSADECLNHEWFNVSRTQITYLLNQNKAQNIEDRNTNQNKESVQAESAPSSYFLGPKISSDPTAQNNSNSCKNPIYTNTPMSKQFNSPSTTRKLRYNHQQNNENSNNHCVPSSLYKEDFSLLLNKVTPTTCQKSTNETRNVHIEEQFFDEMDSEFSDMDLKFTLCNMNEIEEENEISKKIDDQQTINDFLNIDKSLTTKNKRKLSIF